MLLCAGGNGRRIVGIWGTSGIGKTTIAKAIYNAIAHKFEGCCFLADVRENSMPHGGLIQLQETLLQEILGGNKLKIVSADKGISIIQKLLRHKRILLILDDVNQLEQLDNLAGVGWFGEGSRVIITTQDSGLLKCYGIELIYEVHKLYDNQALELFSLNAFGRNEPPNDYLERAKRAIAYAQGLPLALTLLGSHLRIQKILRKSYDALDNSVQQVFLDISCFFKGMRKLEKFKYMPKLKSLNLSGCQFLKKISDLSIIPNIKSLNLSKCTSLVEVNDSVGLLDKLVELNLDGCFKLTRFATALRLKSLERLCLRNCGRLESFPEIEDKLESLVILNIGESGIRGLSSSAAYLTGITFMSAGYCDNLTFTSLRSIYGLQRLTTLGDKVTSDSNISLALPKLVFFNLQGCNLSESNFVLPLDCWFTFTFLDPSGNNFVRCPGHIRKFANLWFVRLNGCKGLQEIPELLRPSVDRVLLPNCTSLENFPKLPQGVRWLDLVNCHRLGGYEIDRIFSACANRVKIT
ncbi:disease resistance protein TAO1 [Prunus persica]|uniref:disease resistance protein TAO1 n=1 Tax=Prunus persica TaxID=3760 RepID=UPI0009AB65EB|nr:disease resistance protein TAO1 [Prunus persica]